MSNKYIVRSLSFLQYFGSTLFVAVIQVCINPLLAKNLSPEDYAIIGYYSSFNLLITPLVTFFLTNFFIQRFFRVSEDERAVIKATVVKMLVYFSFLLAALSLGCLYVYHIVINKGSDIPFMPYAFLTVFAIPLTGIYSLRLAEYRLKREAKKFAIFTIVNGIVAVGLALLFVVIIKWGAFGRLTATILANAIIFLIIVYLERNNLKGRFDKSIFMEMIKFCWPLVIAGMLEFFNSGLDRVLLERLGDLKELGYYSVGAQIAGYLSIFSNAINSTFQPDIYECYSKRNYKRLFVFVGIVVGSIAIAALCYIALAPFIIDILTAGRYVYSSHYSQIIALSTVTAAIYYSSSQITIAMGFTKLLMWVKLLGGVLTAFAFMWLIKNYAYDGAAFGGVISYLIYFVINVSALLLFKRKSLKTA